MDVRSGIRLALLANVGGVSALTCGDVYSAYHSGQCCGNEAAAFDDNALYKPAPDCVNYAFSLEDLPAEQNLDFVPSQECFYPVTLPAFIEAGLVNYSWVPHSRSNEHAPSGAYVYQTSSGGVLYKKITSVPVDTADALVFSCAHAMPRSIDAAEARALGTAAQCFQAPISLETEPFTSYSNFFWVQMPWMDCGAFVYQTEADGPLMYHSCDAATLPAQPAGDEGLCTPNNALASPAESTSTLTCGDIHSAYQSEQCSGMASQTFDEQVLFQPADDCVPYAFILEDLTAEEANNSFVPSQECFYPVTLQAFIDAGLVNYSWVPHSRSPEAAPSGAFVYQTSSGDNLYKKITSVPVDTADALVFSCAHVMPRSSNAAEAAVLGTAAQCFEAPISLDTAPFTSYSNFFWVQMPWMDCGAFVYQTQSEGPIMYHTCDAPAPAPPPAPEGDLDVDLCPTTGLTCGDMQGLYQSQQCSDPSQDFNETALYEPASDCVNYAFMLEDLPQEQNPAFMPSEDCFYPVTLPALYQASPALVSYSWVPPSRSGENAPLGAFVYQTADGEVVYKKVTSVPADTAAVDLVRQPGTQGKFVFSCAHAMPRHMTLSEASAFGSAAQCFETPFSMEGAPFSTEGEPLSAYSHNFWMQMPWNNCGAFVHQTRGEGPLMYHTCDGPDPHPVEDGAIEVSPVGNSGKLRMFRTELGFDNDPNAVVIELDSLEELDADGNAVGASGQDRHSVQTFANQDFTFEDVVTDWRMGLDYRVTANKLSFGSPVGEVGEISVDAFTMRSRGHVGPLGEELPVRPGDMKFNVNFPRWRWCGDEGSDCRRNEVGAFLELAIKIKGNLSEVTPVDGMENTYNLGGNKILTLTRQVTLDGATAMMPEGFPALRLQGSSQIFTFRFPRFEVSAEYDPTVVDNSPEVEEDPVDDPVDGSDGSSGSDSVDGSDGSDGSGSDGSDGSGSDGSDGSGTEAPTTTTTTTPAPYALEAGGMSVTAVGNSGKLRLFDAQLGQQDPNMVVIEMDSLEELDAEGNAVGASGQDRHSVQTFANQDFTFQDIVENHMMGLDNRVTANKLSFGSPVGSVGEIAIDAFIMRSQGRVGPAGEELPVRPGDMKWNVRFPSWRWCGDDGSSCRANEVGAFLELKIKIKGAGDTVTQVEGMENTYNLGGNKTLTLTRQATLDGQSGMLPEGFPSLTMQGSSQIFTFRFPRFETSAEYDPTVVDSSAESDEEFNGGNVDGDSVISGAAALGPKLPSFIVMLLAATMKPSLALPMAAVAMLPALGEAVSCGDVQAAYQTEQCCGAAARAFDESALYQPADDCVNYAFSLEDLPAEQNPEAVPDQECFYPVTLPAFIDAGLVNYSWVPHSRSNEHAPSGAFVYQTSSGGVLYKKIASVPVDTADALVFSCAHTMPRAMTVQDAKVLGTASRCFEDTISLQTAPFTSYSHFSWVQMPWMNCGAFVYQTQSEGSLMYHTCDQ